MRSESEVRDDVHALWAAVFGQPPIVEAPTQVLIDTLVASLPKADYDTLRRVEFTSSADGLEEGRCVLRDAEAAPAGLGGASIHAVMPAPEERSFDQGSRLLGHSPAPAHSPATVSGPSSA